MSAYDNSMAISADDLPPAATAVKSSPPGNHSYPSKRHQPQPSALQQHQSDSGAGSWTLDAAAAVESQPPAPTSAAGAGAGDRLNVNGYASKKSLAQGMLDLALLAANAAQLKFVLSSGESHPFYTLLLVLIVTSIVLQVLQVITCLILGLVLDLNKVDDERKCNIINNISLSIIVVVVVLNVVISAFDMKTVSDLARLMLSRSCD